jgi:acetylornithine aminotransferase/acetylornithine/N-succinyldiaminopimelate aminotransferase
MSPFEEEKYLMNTYKRYPIKVVRAKGTRLWDQDGKEYLDFLSGIAVLNLGHCHPKIVEAVKDQAERFFHVSNLFYVEPQLELAKRICENSFGDKVFFCNSGAEANEAAIKLVRKWAKKNRGFHSYKIITFYGSFHGRTLGTLTATAQERFHEGFDPLVPGFKYCAYNDVEALLGAIDDETCAVMLEVIQGEGGVIVPSDNYLEEVRRICDQKGILLILDEVQTGMGRTGKLFGYEHFSIEPDIMTLAKALGGGLPLGAMVAKEHIASVFSPGDHASTFGGNPLSCRAGCVVFEELLEGGVLENCRRQSQYLFEHLRRIAEENSKIKEIRGKGLMIGIELEGPWAEKIVHDCLNKGLILNAPNPRVLRLLPPLVITQGDCDLFLEIFQEVLSGI